MLMLKRRNQIKDRNLFMEVAGGNTDWMDKMDLHGFFSDKWAVAE
jgi:hypothetical protein